MDLRSFGDDIKHRGKGSGSKVSVECYTGTQEYHSCGLLWLMLITFASSK